MTWLITGGAGQLAKSLAELLESEGKPFIALSKNDLEIGSPDAIEKIIGFNPRALINCAAYTAVDKAETEIKESNKVNREGAKNVALAAKELNIPLIHISTDYVFSGNSNAPWLTTDKTEPISQYGRSKLEGELEIQNIYPEGSRILRTAWLYGPHGKNFAKTILKKALSSNEDLSVVNDQVGQPTSTDALALQIFRSLNAMIPAGIYHATCSGETTWFEFARELLALSGGNTKRVRPVPASAYPTPAQRPKYSVLDQSAWAQTTIQAMDNWELALRKTFPQILKEVEQELGRG